jgi:hypothetical protein
MEEGNVNDLLDFELEETISFIVEIDKNEHLVYITQDNGSSCNYNYESKEDIVNAVKFYIDDYMEDKL